MDIVNKLNEELLNQDFEREKSGLEELDRYKLSARGYADVENVLAVLSDMCAGHSHVYYGRFASMLGLSSADGEQQIGSIWEDCILERIHPDDLYTKHLMELRFFHFIKHQPRSRRCDYYLVEKLRMRDRYGNYLSVMHRMFYVEASHGHAIRFALCLYGPLQFDVPAGGWVVDSVTGRTTKMEQHNGTSILSARERQVLLLIDKGMTSKHVADELSISVNTVSRHRQTILEKLKVGNSIEACRIAKDLGII